MQQGEPQSAADFLSYGDRDNSSGKPRWLEAVGRAEGQRGWSCTKRIPGIWMEYGSVTCQREVLKGEESTTGEQEVPKQPELFQGRK